METDPDRACVIGNGGWGTALALLLLSRGRDVALWGHSKEELDDIRARGENVPYLPGVTVPGELRLTDDPAEAAAGAGLVVVAAPSQFYETVCARFRGLLAEGADAVSVSKGFCAGTGDRLSVAAARALGTTARVVAYKARKYGLKMNFRKNNRTTTKTKKQGK